MASEVKKYYKSDSWCATNAGYTHRQCRSRHKEISGVVAELVKIYSCITGDATSLESAIKLGKDSFVLVQYQRGGYRLVRKYFDNSERHHCWGIPSYEVLPYNELIGHLEDLIKETSKNKA